MDITSSHHGLPFCSLCGGGCREGEDPEGIWHLVAGPLALESESRLRLSAVGWALPVSSRGDPAREARRGCRWGAGKAEGLETEEDPEYLGVVARARLSVRFTIPKVTRISGRSHLQPHSGPGLN